MNKQLDQKQSEPTVRLARFQANLRTVFLVSLILFFALGPISGALYSQEQTFEDQSGQILLRIFIMDESPNPQQLDLPFALPVDNPSDAQVSIQIEQIKKDSGSIEFKLSFQGQKEFDGDHDELSWTSENPEDMLEVKSRLTQLLKMGLMRYVGKMSISEQVSIDFLDQVEPTAVKDPWNFWVFNISANTFLNGETSIKSSMYSGSFSANRVTPEWKIRASVSGYYDKTKYSFDDQVIDSSSDSYNARGLIVKNLGPHWSIGGYLGISSAAYNNISFSISPAPALEFNLFPYEESTRRQFRFLYRLNFSRIQYREETIFEKTQENLWAEALTATLDLKQNWGTISASLAGSHYFHDFEKNRLEFSGDISIRIVEGLNINIYGRYSRIRDQLSLPRSEASFEEVLLRLQQLETSYNYSISIGISYSFGSTKSNVVNPRFGSGGGTSISISM